MDFIAQYSLFVLKAITLVLAFLFLIGGIIALTKTKKVKLQITSLNEQYDDIKRQMSHEIKGSKIKALKLSKKDKKKQQDKASLFVIDFNGDIKASEVEPLREEISAILSIADRNDEILIRLESPGGAVNGYGLAASQLQRIRDKNIPLTICIDKIAASGGYLMSCVANTIIAAPFAIVGSIGVVAQLPNFHRWLKKHDIDIELITAGEYKRTLTLLGENTEKGRKKFKDDIENIHQAFRNYVFKHRKEMDIDKVATGEYWLAVNAYDLGLIDKLETSDEYLIGKMIEGYNAYKISWHCKESLTTKLLKPVMKIVHPWA